MSLPDSVKKGDLEPLTEYDPWFWAYYNNLKLGSGQFNYTGYEFQPGWMQCTAQRKVARKATQLTLPLALDTPVPTRNGWKTIESISVGDEVFGVDGYKYPVIYKSEVLENSPCYKITFCDGTEIVADENHRWPVTIVRYKSKKTKTTKELFDTFPYRGGDRNRYSVLIPQPIQYDTQNLTIDPYLLGLWLGDGNSYSAQITAHKNDAALYSKILSEKNIPHVARANDKRNCDIRNIKLECSSDFYDLCLYKNKHIPEIYLIASIEQRLELLRGLIDTDGHIDTNGMAFFDNINHRLLDNVLELVCSLGLKAVKRFRATCMSWDGTEPTGNELYAIQFRIDNRFRIAYLERKHDRQKTIVRKTETSVRYIKNIERVGSVPTQCISVDSEDHLFVISKTFIPTHNTESEVIDSLHGCIQGLYPKGVLYLFPTRNDVTDFSAARFKPLITENDHAIGKYVKDTNRENLKRVGNGFLYFRSGHVTSATLKSIPVDKVVFDEYDEMGQAVRGMAVKRMASSTVQKEVYLANPTLTDYGVDKLYESESDRSIWEIKCQKCGKHSCLETHFPECLERLNNGKVIRLCPKCRDRELYTKDGRWIPRNPDRTEWMAGFWISHLNNQFINPKEILDAYERLHTMKSYDVGQFWNLTIGIGFVDAANRLSIEQILELCGDEGIPNSDPGPCSMGVDQGNDIHVVIGKPPGKIVYVGVHKEWEDLDPLMRYFNVGSCVVDALPEKRNAFAFAGRHTGRVYCNFYNENQKGSYAWNEGDFIVQCNRTESLDASHKQIMDKLITLPKPCEVVQDFADQMHNVAKKLEEDEETGSKRYVYIKLGDDHFRHAFNYECMARGVMGTGMNLTDSRDIESAFG